jgi:lipopolysaccharide/colanic/teichoic acid biosynthesis glycosyltransferase
MAAPTVDVHFRTQDARKRALDLALVLFALPIAVPIAALVGLLILLTMGRPILFRQERVGRGERRFLLWKFRTMRPAAGPDWDPTSDKDRLTSVGGALRRTSLDELPQLWNVLRGEMSLVGPRPLPAVYQPYFNERERLRFAVLPGITGWAQVNGRNFSGWDDRLDKDVWYVEHWSLSLDLRILARTLGQILLAKDIVPDPSSVMLSLDRARAHPAPRFGSDAS